MTKTANTDLNAITAPTTAEMLEMLNVDVLPFFDGYDESTFSFSEKYRAVSVIAETENGFVVSLNDGKEIEVSKAYFQFPGTEKENTLFALKNTLS
jgi:hypothetical protein